MNIRIVDQKANEVPESPQEDVSHEELLVSSKLLEDQVSQIFDILPKEMGLYRDKVRTIVDYAKSKTDDHSPESIKWQIRRLGVKLGTPPLGEKLINYMHVYAKLHMQQVRLEQEKKQFLKGGRDK